MSDHLSLELQTVVSHGVGAGRSREGQGVFLTEPSLQPMTDYLKYKTCELFLFPFFNF